jgi:hypothetical protein
VLISRSGYRWRQRIKNMHVHEKEVDSETRSKKEEILKVDVICFNYNSGFEIVCRLEVDKKDLIASMIARRVVTKDHLCSWGNSMWALREEKENCGKNLIILVEIGWGEQVECSQEKWRTVEAKRSRGISRGSREREPQEYQKTRLRRGLVRYWITGWWRELVTKAWCSIQVDKVKFTRDGEMTIDGHCMGSERSHNRREEIFQGKWHEKEDESRRVWQRNGWAKGEAQCHTNVATEENERELETRMESEEIQVASDATVCEEVKENIEDLGAQVECLGEEGGTQRSWVQTEAIDRGRSSLLWTEQGDILGEDERLAGSLMNSLESSYQHEDMLTEGSIEDEQPNIFKTNILCVVAGFAGDGNHLKLLWRRRKKNKCILTSLKRGQSHNSILKMEDETTLSHKDSQEDDHTPLNKEIVERQLEKNVVATRKGDLAHEDSQREVEDKHSYAMLTRWNEEIELLEEFLRKHDSERRESTTRREEACSKVHYSEGEVPIASKEKEVNFNFQIKLKDAGITKNNEHDWEVASRLFLKDEFEPQIQHSELMNFEEEMKFMEEWLAKGTSNEDCKKIVTLKEKIKMPNDNGMDEEKSKNHEDIREERMQQLVDNKNNQVQQMDNNNNKVFQQLVRDNNNKFQQRDSSKVQNVCQQKDKLDMEIEMMRNMMMTMSHKRHTKVKKTFNNIVQWLYKLHQQRERGRTIFVIQESCRSKQWNKTSKTL